MLRSCGLRLLVAALCLTGALADSGSSDTKVPVLGIFFIVYFGFFGLILLWYLFKRIVVVEQGTAMVVERLGKFHRRLDAGIHFLVPFFDAPRPVIWRFNEVYLRGNKQQMTIHQSYVTRIDLRETVLDFPSQPIITRDNVLIEVHPMLLYRLCDPVRVAYETYDLPLAVEKLVQTTLRSIIGNMGLDDTLASREEIERGLRVRIKNICNNWGLDLKSVELLEITPTPTVQSAMHKQLAAERLRRAAIVSAEGFREKVKTEAEGTAQAAIAMATADQQVAKIKAKSNADARRLIAKAEADAVTIVAEALEEHGLDASQYLVSLKYISSLVALACSAARRTIYVPFQANLVGMLGSQ